MKTVPAHDENKCTEFETLNSALHIHTLIYSLIVADVVFSRREKDVDK